MLWSLNILECQLVCVASALAYVYGWKAAGGIHLPYDDADVFLFIGAVEVAFALSSLCFFCLIDKKFLRTFTDQITGPSYAVWMYNIATTDASKFQIFYHHRSFYRAKENELEKWLLENWDDWLEGRPEWFTAAAKAKIPPSMMMPSEEANLESLSMSMSSSPHFKRRPLWGQNSSLPSVAALSP